MWNDTNSTDPGNWSASLFQATLEAECVRQSRFYIQTLLGGVLCLGGVVTNAISIFIMGQDRETSTVASLMLRSLAFADIFFLCVWLAALSIPTLFDFTDAQKDFHHPTWLYFRVGSYPLIFIGQMATIWMTVLIAGSRYLIICQPYRAPRFCSLPSARISLVLLVVFSVVYNLPRYFETTITTDDQVDSETGSDQSALKLERTKFGESSEYQIIYFDILYYIFTLFLPFILMTTCNFCLIFSYREQQRKRAILCPASSGRQKRSQQEQKQEQNITLVMIIVVVVFIVCNTPARIVQMVSSYKVQVCPSLMFFLLEFASVLEVFGSSTNFFVYYTFRKQFRRIFKQFISKFAAARRRSEVTSPNAQDIVLDDYDEDGFQRDANSSTVETNSRV